MKSLKTLVAAVLLTIGAMVANAQPGGGMGRGGQRMDPEQVAKMRADEMKTAVNLTDEQYTKVVALYKEQMDSMQKMMQQQGQNRQNGREMMEQVRKEQETKLKAILTEDQFKKWSESEQSRRGRMGGPGGPGRRP